MHSSKWGSTMTWSQTRSLLNCRAKTSKMTTKARVVLLKRKLKTRKAMTSHSSRKASSSRTKMHIRKTRKVLSISRSSNATSE